MLFNNMHTYVDDVAVLVLRLAHAQRSI